MDQAQSYSAIDANAQFLLPITPEGFEAVLAEVTTRFKLPADDRCRQVLAGYIHHIPNEQDSTTLAMLGTVLRKSIANQVSWRIDQDIKEKARAALAAIEAQKNEESTLAQVGSNAASASSA